MGYPFHAPATGKATITAVTVSTEIAPANANRKGVLVLNDSTATLYLTLGAVSASDSFTLKMQPGAYFECPYGYSGPVSGIWDAANGSAKVTEVF